MENETTDTPESDPPDQPKGADAGQAEVQAKVDVETEQGYSGVKVDPLPNLAYSIQTGPDSPTGIEGDDVRFAQHSASAPKQTQED